MTHNIAVVGVDGVGKSTIRKGISQRLLENGHSLVKEGRYSYYAHGQTAIPIGHNLTSLWDKIHAKLDKQGYKTIIGLANVLSTMSVGILSSAATYHHKPNIRISSRDTVVDAAVYAAYYFPFTAKWSYESRLEIAQALTTRSPSDHIIYLDASISTVLQRLEERMRRTHQEREKWLHIHENAQDMTYIREQYLSMLDYLRPNHTIHIVDTEYQGIDEVIDEAFTLIQEQLSH